MVERTVFAATSLADTGGTTTGAKVIASLGVWSMITVVELTTTTFATRSEVSVYHTLTQLLFRVCF
jgi:hypothetical protein